MDIQIPRVETLSNAEVAFTVNAKGTYVVLSYDCCINMRSCGLCKDGRRTEVMIPAVLKERIGLTQYEKVCKSLFDELLTLRKEEGWALRTREGTWWYTSFASKCSDQGSALIFSSLAEARKVQKKDSYEETNPHHGGWEIMRYRRFEELRPQLKVQWERER